MNIGVLGGSNFIGYHLTCGLAQAGHNVTLFNRGRTLPPGPLPPTVTRVYGDRNRPDQLAAFIAGRVYDAIFDLSGYVPAHIAPFVTARGRASIGQYVFCSTSIVYAPPTPCPCPETAARVSQRGTYGGDKARVEDVLLQTCEDAKWPVTIVRPQGVFGAFQPAQTAVAFSRLHAGLPVILPPSWASRLNMLFVADLIRVFLRILETPAARGQTYNVAGDEAVTAVDLTERCAAAANSPLRLRPIASWPYEHLRLGFPWPAHNLVLENDKVKRDLGIAFTPLSEALASTWKWLQARPALLQPDLLRGERYIAPDGTMPWWLKAVLRAEDLTFRIRRS